MLKRELLLTKGVFRLETIPIHANGWGDIKSVSKKVNPILACHCALIAGCVRINEYVKNTRSSKHGKLTDRFNWSRGSVVY